MNARGVGTREAKRTFLRRADSPIHVGLGVATAVAAPILALPYGVYLWRSYDGGGCGSAFVQGLEYGAGYVLGAFLIGQIFPVLNQ